MPQYPQRKPHHHRNSSSSSSLPTVLEATPLLNNNNRDDGANGDAHVKGSRHDVETSDFATPSFPGSTFLHQIPKHCQQIYVSLLDHASRTRAQLLRLLPTLDRDGARFAMRMSVILSFCTLFVLCNWIDHGFWVYVTVLNVSWFPRLDAASVMEKTLQRWMGTMLGAALGLACGFLSLLVPASPQHEIFLFAATAAVVFAVLATAGTVRVGGAGAGAPKQRKRIIDMYSYATCLCMLTLGVALLPFASVQEDIWKVGIFRVLNVSIGCCIGAAGSVLLWPRPTLQMLHQKTARQVILAGEAAEAVLHTAVDAFSGKRSVSLLSEELLQQQKRYNFITKTLRKQALANSTSNDSNLADVALEKYEDAIQDWMVSKSLFPLLRFDPFSLLKRRLCVPDKSKENGDSDIATTLARALRIQTTVVVLDGMIRYDVHSEYNFTDETLQIFTETGTLIRQLLALPIDWQPSDEAITARRVEALFENLDAIRQRVRRAAATLVEHTSAAAGCANDNDEDEDAAAILDFRKRLIHKSQQRNNGSSSSNDNNNYHPLQQSVRMNDNQGRGLPMYTVTTYHSHRLLFFQLVEHLILRSLRLYHQITEVEMHDKLCRCR